MKHPLIFVIDDDFYFRNIVKYSLKKLGFDHVNCYSSGQEAFIGLSEKPAIVFLDYYLDDMLGSDLLEEIKNSLPQTHVIMFSSQEDLEIAVCLIKNGAYEYIKKSDDPYQSIAHVLQEIQQEVKMEKKDKVLRLQSIW